MSTRPAERYRGERVDLYNRIPFYVKHVLIVGEDIVTMCRLLQRRSGVTVYGVETDADKVAFLAGVLGETAYPSIAAFLAAAPSEALESVVFLDPDMDETTLTANFRDVRSLLGPMGNLSVVTANPDYWRVGATREIPAVALIGEAARHADFHTYIIDAADDTAFLEAANSAGGAPFEIEGKQFPESSPEERVNWASEDFYLVFVRPDYNPLEHAHALLEANDPGGSYEVLDRIPKTFPEDSVSKAVVNTEMMLCLARWQQQDPNQDRLQTLARGQELFYATVSSEPAFVPAYRCEAELWRQAGSPEMGCRLLRSVLHIAPDADATAQLERLSAVDSPNQVMPPPPEWDGDGAPMRVLFITHPRPHYGLDVLYDGLCQTLGGEAVTDFPWKGTLHGAPLELHRNYPCNFDWPGTPQELGTILQQLRDRAYDVVLWGDCEGSIPKDAARAIIEAAGETPVFILDQIDEFVNTRAEVEEWIGRPADAYFKREMLACVDYGPTVFPLPFAYPDGRVSAPTSAPRSHDLFWAGHRMFGLRELYLQQIEASHGIELSEHFEADEYARRVADSRIGLNIFGYGFDTVRYWELPAHGAMLFSERLPIHIPHNFRDGEMAVFFDDLPDLESKLTGLLADAERVHTIATAGHHHLLKHHTGSARAKQLLGWIQQTIEKSVG